MRRSIETVLFLTLLFFCQTLPAQNYAGGSFSIASNWNKVEQGSLANTFSIGLSPEFGWFAGERWTVGFKPSVGFAASSSNESRSVQLGISPYARYRFLEFKKFGLWAEVNAGFKYAVNLNASKKYSQTFSYGIGIRPVLTYDLSQRISLYGAVNLFSLSLYGYSTYYYDTSKWMNSFSFALAGQSDNVIDPLSQISIGFFYKF